MNYQLDINLLAKDIVKISSKKDPLKGYYLYSYDKDIQQTNKRRLASLLIERDLSEGTTLPCPSKHLFFKDIMTLLARATYCHPVEEKETLISLRDEMMDFYVRHYETEMKSLLSDAACNLFQEQQQSTNAYWEYSKRDSRRNDAVDIHAGY